MKKLYVGNMESSTTAEDLKTALGAYGPVADTVIVMDKATGVPRGFGFVEMTGDKDAHEAILGLNGSSLAGKTIIVSEAHAKNNQSGTAGRR